MAKNKPEQEQLEQNGLLPQAETEPQETPSEAQAEPQETPSEAQAEPQETPSEAQAESQETVKARVLSDGIYGQANDIVEVPPVIAEHSADLDAGPAAVAYAESLQNEYA